MSGPGAGALGGAAAGARRRAWALALAATGTGVLALAVRLVMVRRSFDVDGDEIIYARLGESALAGGFPRYQGEVFFLHPPGFFYLEAGWEALFGTHRDTFAAVYELRLINVLLAAGTAAVLVLLAARAGSLRAGLVAGLVFALDPYCIRTNDRLLLETAMMFWVLLGYLALAGVIRRPPSGRARLLAVAAGVLFGLGVLTKDSAALITVLPLLVVFALGWGPRRAMTLLTVAATAATYGSYVLVVAGNGYFRDFWGYKTYGVKRLVGLLQTTGFNRPGSPALSSRVLAEAPYFAATFVMLALGAVGLVLVLRRGGRLPRLLGVMDVTAFVALGYGFAFGTLEEQQLYPVLVPGMVMFTVGATLWRGRPARGRLRQRAAAAAVAVLLAMSVSTCGWWLAHPDNGYQRVREYLAAHLRPGYSVSEADPYQAAMLDDRFRTGSWLSPAERQRERVRYLVVPWKSIDEGYAGRNSVVVGRVADLGRRVFYFPGRSYGELDIYRLPLPSERRGGPPRR